jgi:S1-C subfamily serine protease
MIESSCFLTSRRIGLLAFMVSCRTALAFSFSVQTRRLFAVSNQRSAPALFASTEPVLQGAEYLEFELFPHRPLGCTVDESLAVTTDKREYVFVSKVNPGGNAEKAGLRTGDVIVGITGIFGDFEDVGGEGIDKV